MLFLTNDADHVYTPGGPPPKDYVGHVTLAISNDGLVYVADTGEVFSGEPIQHFVPSDSPRGSCSSNCPHCHERVEASRLSSSFLVDNEA